MLTMLFSVAISLVPVHAFFTLAQQTPGSHQTPQSQQIQQEKKDSPTYYVLNLPLSVSITPTPLPDGDNAWAVQIVSRGGLTGSGRGNVTLTSNGILIRFGPDGSCSKRLSEESLRAISKAVFSATGSYTSDALVDRLMCQECIETALLVQRRKTAGDETTLTALWQDATQAKVSADILNIYQSVMESRECKLQ